MIVGYFISSLLGVLCFIYSYSLGLFNYNLLFGVTIKYFFVFFQDIDDVDFSMDLSSLSARWVGFAHPHQSIKYKIFIGTSSGSSDVTGVIDMGSKTECTVQGLTLTLYQVSVMHILNF